MANNQYDFANLFKTLVFVILLILKDSLLCKRTENAFFETNIFGSYMGYFNVRVVQS